MMMLSNDDAKPSSIHLSSSQRGATSLPFIGHSPLWDPFTTYTMTSVGHIPTMENPLIHTTHESSQYGTSTSTSSPLIHTSQVGPLGSTPSIDPTQLLLALLQVASL